MTEIEDHKDKLKRISKYSESELHRSILLITGRIRFINIKLISKQTFHNAESLTTDIDIDDTEFVALTEHAKAKLWSEDKELLQGLIKKKWNKFVTTEELYKLILTSK